MDMKIPAIAITAFVVIIVLAGVLMPVLDDATTVKGTFTNEGRYYITTDIEDDITILMNYDVENNVKSWYIDGELLTYNDYPSTNAPEFVKTPTVAGADNLVFRTDGRYRGLASSTGGNDYDITVTKDSIVRGTIATSNPPLFVASTKETDNVMRNDPNKVAYVLGDSEILACGYTMVAVDSETNTNAVISFTGSVKEGVQVTVFDLNNQFTVENVSVNAEKVNGYKDLYAFTSVTFDVKSANDLVTSCVYSMVVLPSEVSAERTVHFTDNQNAIFAAIPVMVILALLVGVAIIVLRSRQY